MNHTGTLNRHVTTTLNGRQATLQLDNGSPISIISEETWRNIAWPVSQGTQLIQLGMDGPLRHVDETIVIVQSGESFQFKFLFWKELPP